jgi:uncharacterized membrane protein
MKNILFISIIFLIIGSITIISCRHEPDPNLLNDTICFDSQVLPIFISNCTVSGCHNAGFESGLDFTNYASIANNVVAGDPYKSRIYKAISKPYNYNYMPPKNKYHALTEDQRKIIYLWIKQGALNTSCSGTDTTQVIIKNDSVCFTRDILPVISSSCALSNCHDNITAVEGLTLMNYAQIRSHVKPGYPNSSSIYNALLSSAEERMPPSGPLTTTQIYTINKWIKEGAKNSDCANDCDTSKYTYTNEIHVIIENSCLGCHNASNASFGIRLDSYDYIKAVGTSGDLVNVINKTNGKPQMPPSSPLIDCQKTQIQKWVNAGMPQN